MYHGPSRAFTTIVRDGAYEVASWHVSGGRGGHIKLEPCERWVPWISGYGTGSSAQLPGAQGCVPRCFRCFRCSRCLGDAIGNGGRMAHGASWMMDGWAHLVDLGQSVETDGQDETSSCTACKNLQGPGIPRSPVRFPLAFRLATSLGAGEASEGGYVGLVPGRTTL